MTSDDPQAPEGRAEVPPSPENGGADPWPATTPTPTDTPGSGGPPSGPAGPTNSVGPAGPAVRAAGAGRSTVGRRTVAAVAVAVGLAVAGGVAIAATGASTGIGNAALGHPGGYGYSGEARPGDGQGGPGMPGGRGGIGGALHGEFVVPDGNGGYATRLLQSGRITAVDGDSLTVASDDGHSTTYTITSSTTFHGIASAADLAVDGTVTVVADEDAAALTIGDRPARGGGPGGPAHRGPGDGPGRSPAPQPTT
jgi:hypothetical protein